MIESTIHTRINGRKPNSFLVEQIQRDPARLNDILSNHRQVELTRLLSNQKGLKEDKDVLAELADKSGTVAARLTMDYIKQENMLFREFYEQIREKILPVMDAKLKELEKLELPIKKSIEYEQLSAYVSAIHSFLLHAPHWGWTPKRLSECCEKFWKLSYKAENIQGIHEEVRNVLFELEMWANNIVNLYYSVTNPQSSTWKTIAALQKKNNDYWELFMQQQQKEQLEYKKGPVIKLMKYLANRFVEYNQNGTLKYDFSSRFSSFLTMKFASFDALVDYLISDENPYKILLLSNALWKEVVEFSEKDQIKILEKLEDFSEDNTQLNVFYYDYVHNLRNRTIAQKLASHKSKRVREYLLYNDVLPKNFMFDKILPILKHDDNEHIKEKATELYNTII